MKNIRTVIPILSILLFFLTSCVENDVNMDPGLDPSSLVKLTIYDADDWTSEDPEFKPVENAVIKLYVGLSDLNNDQPLQTLRTSKNGEVLLTNQVGTEYIILVQKGAMKNTKNDYVIAGVFESMEDINSSPSQNDAQIGHVKYLDSNNDGIIDDQDKVSYQTLSFDEPTEVGTISEQSIYLSENESNHIWENWYLSIPLENEEGKATSIFFNDILNDNFFPEQAEYFYQNEDESYTLFTKFTGYTTSGSYPTNAGKYCRTELREFWKGEQSVYDNWYMDGGTHILESTLKVDYCGGYGSTIIAQIHGKETDLVPGNPATVKIFWSGGNIRVFHYTKPDEGEDWSNQFENRDIVLGAVDNEKFTIKLKVEEGKFYYGLRCDTKDIDIDYTFAFDYKSNGYDHANYFKTGNYFVYSSDYEETAQVKFYKAITHHY